MEGYRFHHHPLYGRLAAHALSMNGEDCHLKTLILADNRMADFSATGGGIFFDYSRQRVDATTMALLVELADGACVKDRFADMANGKKVNVTENRAALHMAARNFSAVPIYVDERDIKADLETVRRQIQQFSGSVHRGEIIGSTGQPFRHVVVVGIGGSYLGTQFVANALESFADKGVSLEFLANVDIHNFGRIWSRIQPDQTLWVIISKSYTTAETMANEDLIRRHMNGSGLDPSRHLITVTSKGSPGDGGDGRGLAAFHMFDFIGGRYSVTSAVGGVPLSLYLGYERFERFLKGAEEMDRHAHGSRTGKEPPADCRSTQRLEHQFSGLSSKRHYSLCVTAIQTDPPYPAAEHGKQREIRGCRRSPAWRTGWYGYFRRTGHQCAALIFPVGPSGESLPHRFHRRAQAAIPDG